MSASTLTPWHAAVPALAAFAATLVFTPLVRAFARRAGLIARPTADRWHQKPTALLGGIGIFAGFTVGILAAALWMMGGAGPELHEAVGRPELGILLGSALMFAVGLVDDKLKLRPATKLIFQGISAGIIVTMGVSYPVTSWPVVNVLLTIFWLLALTNALNLLDNMDGVAVGVAGIAAVFLALSFAWEGAWALSAVCFALFGAAAGFLPYNFHRASIFMGDSGSLFLGSLLAGLGAAYPRAASTSLLSVLFVPALIVVIPILDTTLVTLARTLAGRPISVGGRDHTSHRLVAFGLSEPQVALLLYTFAVCGGLLALILRVAAPGVGWWIGALFLVGLLLFAAYLGKLHVYTPGEEQRTGRAATVLVSELFHKRRAFEVIVDLLVFAIAYYGAYLLRFDGDPPASQEIFLERTLGLAVLGKAAAFWGLGVYRGNWRQLSVADANRVLRAAALGSVITTTGLVFLFRDAEFARSVLVVDGILVALLCLGVRASYRSLETVRHSLNTTGTPILIYGAGVSGDLAVRALLATPHAGLRPIGFLDDDPAKRRRLLHGLPVFGGVDRLGETVADKGVRKVVLGTTKLDAERLAELLAACEASGVELVRFQYELEPIHVPEADLFQQARPVRSSPGTAPNEDPLPASRRANVSR